MAAMNETKVDLNPRRPTVEEVLDAWRERLRGATCGLVEGDDGALVPNVRHLALFAEDLARNLAEAGCDVGGTEGTPTSATVLVGDGSVTIDAEVCSWPGRPTFVRLSIRETGHVAMTDRVRRQFGPLVNASVTQRSLDHLSVDPVLVALPRETLDRLLAIEKDHAALRLDRQAILDHIRSVTGVADEMAPKMRRRWGEELIAEIERGDHVSRYTAQG